jgi:pyruvate kinase
LPLGDCPRYPDVVAAIACQAARTAGVGAIAVFTSSGATARLISRHRPSVPIYALTSSRSQARELLLVYGVHPILIAVVNSTDQMLAMVERTLLEQGRLRAGEGVMVVAGQPVGRPGTTNLLKLHRLGG